MGARVGVRVTALPTDAVCVCDRAQTESGFRCPILIRPTTGRQADLGQTQAPHATPSARKPGSDGSGGGANGPRVPRTRRS